MFSKTLQRVRSLSVFDVLYYVLKFVLSICTAYMHWNLLKLFLNNDMPGIVVLTGSMVPGFMRGDISAIKSTNHNLGIEVGDIVGYSLMHRAIPISHRIIERRIIIDKDFPCDMNSTVVDATGAVLHHGPSSIAKVASPPVLPSPCRRLAFITKGDANKVKDTFLYTTGRVYLEPYEVVGKMLINLPGLGYMTILLQEHKWAKVLLFGMIIFMAISGREE
ncbi:Microsomal signal peptidase 18 kDa subunit [Giardia lamblia P15]|uniref:Signal peptidase complex catalytic subunit SEC11 n=1 Tax=Giardia intestinalis (strain P15) TaxID=658858 RepID=E1F6U9_GIAIA|nr:Microsomal signal peptidase 18 kDa subunit [Giardia lamblia P15]